MYYTKGGISLSKLEEMPFNQFLLFLEEAFRVQELQQKENKQDG